MTNPDAFFAFFTEVGILAQLSQTQFERLMPAGMTLAQFTVLNHCVRVSDGRSPATLARAFQVTKGTMTSTLQRLEQKGLVVIHADPKDGRSKIVRITEAGRAMREACIATTYPWAEDLLAKFDAKEISELIPRLAALRSILDAERD
ncbi:MarR family transcriptional regulator [Rhabdaerophilum sp. SD176]|uniref:MarR family winged helix-turn-helix transcriptional regulator n=1 Tax=Rhabdaerophilum sp. SD176 TaxID=2983548 RepID=UPI0024DF5B81|nr:MarR family transcriptional regulator [Rhabdaerophilum sp. SD176]